MLKKIHSFFGGYSKFILVLLLGNFTVFTYSQSKHSIKLKGGYALSSFNWEEDGKDVFNETDEEFTTINSSFRSSYIAAFNYEYAIVPFLSLETGIMFSGRSVRYERNYEETTTYLTDTYTYKENSKGFISVMNADIPLLVKYNYIKSDFTFYIGAGGFVGYSLFGKMGSTEKYEYTSSTGNNEIEETVYKEGVELEKGEERVSFGFISTLGAAYKDYYFETGFMFTKFNEDLFYVDKASGQFIYFSLGIKLNQKGE